MCLDEGDESTQWENEFLTDESVSYKSGIFLNM